MKVRIRGLREQSVYKDAIYESDIHIEEAEDKRLPRHARQKPVPVRRELIAELSAMLENEKVHGVGHFDACIPLADLPEGSQIGDEFNIHFERVKTE